MTGTDRQLGRPRKSSIWASVVDVLRLLFTTKGGVKEEPKVGRVRRSGASRVRIRGFGGGAWELKILEGSRSYDDVD